MTTARHRPVAMVAGAVGNKPGNGGEAWVRISWVRALESLGFDVVFAERLATVTDPRWNRRAVDWFRQVTEWAGWTGRAWLIAPTTDAEPHSTLVGCWSDLITAIEQCDLLIDISGNLTGFEPATRIGQRVYVDLDPGYTQVWAHDDQLRLDWHHRHATVGASIGQPHCAYPSNELEWIPVRQPVTLDDWPVEPCPPDAPFSTVTTWRGGFGPLQWNGRSSGVKAHSFRRLSTVIDGLPRSARLVVDIDEADRNDLDMLRASGWLVDTSDRTASPAEFAGFVRESAGELSVAHPAYVDGRTGWFSDRTVRYLASGRPAIVEDTGWSNTLPNGDGLLGFVDPDEAAAAVELVCANYQHHSQAAREIAAEWFSPATALGPLLSAVG